MLDMKFVRENPELVMDAMRKRNANVNLDEFLELAAFSMLMAVKWRSAATARAALPVLCA